VDSVLSDEEEMKRKLEEKIGFKIP